MTTIEYSHYSDGRVHASGFKKNPGGNINDYIRSKRVGLIQFIFEYTPKNGEKTYMEYRIYFPGEEAPVYTLNTGSAQDAAQPDKKPCVCPGGEFTCGDDFRSYLIDKVHMKNWQDAYETACTDVRWSLRVCLNTGVSYAAGATHGNRNFPDNFNAFLSVIGTSVEELRSIYKPKKQLKP